MPPFLAAAAHAGALASRYFVWEAHPFIFEFSEGVGPRWYGFSYILGFLAGLWLLFRYSDRGRSPLKREQNVDLVVCLAIGVFVGGRLGYFLFYQPDAFLHPLTLLRVWEGGMASHGGFLGVAVAAWWFARKTKVGFWRLADLAVTVAPPGLFFGRLANFVNAELWGTTTDVPWAVIFRGHGADAGPFPRHPSQLYEAGLEGLLLFAYLQFRFWRSRTAAEKPGQLTGEFLVGYALVRIFCETFREPDAALIAGLLSRGTFYSILMAAAGVVVISLSQLSARRTARPAG